MTTLSIPNTFTPLTTISSSQMNANFTAIVAAFGNSLGINAAETLTGALKGIDGAAALPAFTFGSDTNTGMYLKGADSLAFGSGGTERGYVDPSGNWVWNGTTTLPNTGLHLLDTNASHDLIIAPGSNLTADRTLTITTGDADRTLTLSGNVTLTSTPLVSASLAAQVFTGNGTYTPTTNMVACLVISTGGGGGGGGADCTDTSAFAVGSGGGAGATCVEVFSAATIGASQSVTIGAAGTAGSNSGGNGGNGGDTTFGALHTAGGGIGGDGIQTGDTAFGTLSAGGAASGGALNVPGGPGGLGNSDDTSAFTISGDGGTSYWGGGAGPATSTVTGKSSGQTAGNAGSAYGSGGSGAICINTTTGAAGGAGAAGVCLVIELIAA